MRSQFRWRLELWLFNVIELLISLLPRKACLFIGSGIGQLLFVIDRKHRRTALKNLETAFGEEQSPTARLRIARRSFRHFGRLALDIIKLRRFPPEKIEKFLFLEGEEHIENAVNQGRGVLIFSAHFGNWEAGSLLLAKRSRLNVIARRSDNPFLEAKLSRIRGHFGVHVIYKHMASKKVLQALRNKEMVAILIDQNVLRREAVFVDFFGKQAATTPGLATFHLRTGAPLLPVFSFPAGSGKYCIRAFPPLRIPLTGDSKRDISAITQACTKIIQSRIREDPGMWLWFHDRWRSRP